MLVDCFPCCATTKTKVDTQQMASQAAQEEVPPGRYDAMAAEAGYHPLLLIPGHRLSKMIKEGALTSERLCKVYIERIEQVQYKINAMAEPRFQQALEEARELDLLVARYRTNPKSSEFSAAELRKLNSPLMGVPVSIKESLMVEGMLNSAGDYLRRDTRADYDATAVLAAKRSGLIIICTTNIPELTLFWADCQNPVYGRVNNPYNQSCISGSSSGGEASLLGAAGSVIGLGSDIAGSLRLPGHYCGIFGHKPSPYLISAEGNWPRVVEARFRMFTMGPMCRYASDLRYLVKMLLEETMLMKPSDYKQYDPNEIKRRHPADIQEQRLRLIKLLAEGRQAVDFSKVKLLYSNYAKLNELAALLGQRESQIDPEIIQGQREVLEHFAKKYKCQLVEIDLDGPLQEMYKIWHAMVTNGGTPDREFAFIEHEVLGLFSIENLAIEMLKWLVGASYHTKEALVLIQFGLPTPNDRQAAYQVCDKLEKIAADMKAELEAKLGDNGLLVLPTLPTTAHYHHAALLRTNELRFPTFLNAMQLPATNAIIRLTEKDKLPFGLSIASKAYNDHLTIAAAEEIEATFGGWTPPLSLPGKNKMNKADDKKRN